MSDFETANGALTNWAGVARPARELVAGRYASLVPLDPAAHSSELFAAASAPGAEARFRYLPEQPPASESDMRQWADRAAVSTDPMFFAVVDRATGRAEGRQAMMRIDDTHGVAEIGSIMWGPAMTRSRVATEAFFLTADVIFGLGYRRFEWKCHHGNEPSKRAALRFGFTHEGTFRQHMVMKGANRNTEWFSIIDSEWPRLREGYERWLDPENFDETGAQRTKLTF